MLDELMGPHLGILISLNDKHSGDDAVNYLAVDVGEA